jgi:hypothetical protein
MCKQHLDLLPALTSCLVFRRERERPSGVAGVLMQSARDLSRRCVRAAPRFQFADVGARTDSAEADHIALRVLTAFQSGSVDKETMFAALLDSKDKP